MATVYTAITPPYWEGFANTVSGNFHIAWIMCCTVTVWVYESIWERYPFNLIKTDWLRRMSAFFGIIAVALCLCFFLFYAQDLAWGLNVRGTRREMAPDWRWLHVGECAIFWLVGVLAPLLLSEATGQPSSVGPSTSSCGQSSAWRSVWRADYLYYRYAHNFLGTQKGVLHPQQFPMIPTIWLINIWLINMWFMDGLPGWKAVPRTAEELKQVEENVVANAK